MTQNLQKFGRQFRCTIDPADGKPPIVIMMPFTIEFWVERDTLASLNQFSVNLYNLSEANRRRIFQDRYDLASVDVNNVSTGPRKLTLEIGYGILYKIFEGQIYSASSAREGTNIITRIEGRSGIYDVVTTQISQTYQAGGTLGGLFTYLVGQFPTLTLGNDVSSWTQIFNRPIAMCGTVWDQIKKYSSQLAYIDNSKVFILQQNEVLNTPQLSVNESSGLLETPRRFEGRILVSMLMEPSVSINQLVNLTSLVEPAFNGQYPVIGIRHEGVISGAVGGTVRTVLALLHPTRVSYKGKDGNFFTQVKVL